MTTKSAEIAALNDLLTRINPDLGQWLITRKAEWSGCPLYALIGRHVVIHRKVSGQGKSSKPTYTNLNPGPYVRIREFLRAMAMVLQCFASERPDD
jgi:hypothetical protein